MAALPDSYRWLEREPAPRMLVQALKLYGVREKAGDANNPEILAWAREAGVRGYHADSIPWCGLLMAIVAHRSRKPIPESPLRARSWRKFGKAVKVPELGDVLVFWRKSRDSGLGHVGLYVGEDDAAFHVLGGNQGDAVSIVRIEKGRLLEARRHYAIGVPANVRRVFLSPAGALSAGEG